MLAAERDEVHGEAVNIACGERTTLNEIVKDINRLLGHEHRAGVSGCASG